MRALRWLVLGLVASWGCGSVDAIEPMPPWHHPAPIGDGGTPSAPLPEASVPIPTAPAPPTALDAKLVPAEGCDVTLAELRDAAAKLMDSAVDTAFRTYAATCFPDSFIMYPTINGGGGMVVVNPPDPSRPVEYTGTNNQVSDVDEPDFIKTDGKYFYVATPTGLKILSAWPAEQATILSSTIVAGTPFALFVSGSRLVLYARRYPGVTGIYAQALVSYIGSPCTYGYDCEVNGDGSQTSMFVFDVADPARPLLLRRIDSTGAFLAARRIGTAVHTLLYDGARLPSVSVLPEPLAAFDPKQPKERACNPDLNYAAIEALFADLHDRNRAIIAALPAEALLPALADTKAAGIVAPCDHVMKYQTPVELQRGFTTASTALNLLSLASVDMAADGAVALTAIESPPGFAYASANAFYVGVSARAPGNQYNVQYETLLHKMTLDGAASRYAASGVVSGKILNQFAMDEQQGYLRVAGSTAQVPSYTAQTVVSVVAEQDGGLGVAGSIGGIAPGEDVRSVRFDGDRGYVVTFKKTDPLFVLDMSDPKRPSVLGELKVPGFSTYIHKIDATHLLTLGYDAVDQGDFAWFSGIRLQIVDVTNLAAPKLLAADVIGTRGSSSEALTNHLAFTYLASQGVLTLPMTICEGSDAGGVYGDQMTFSGLVVYRATAAGVLAQLGRIAHEPLASDEPTDAYARCFTWWTDAHSAVKRSFIMDDYVYSVSEEIILASRLADLAHPVRSVSLSGQPTAPDAGVGDAGAD
jgi:hypothetical protein